MPLDDAGKMSLLWTMLNEYCDIFRNVLRGKCDNKKLSFLKDEGGYKIKVLYKQLLQEFTGDYKATAVYKDEDIQYALSVHEGDSIPGFPSVDAFIFLLTPQLEKLKEPIEECFQEVYNYIEMLSGKILEKSFQRFPQIINDMGDFINTFLVQVRDKAKYLVDNIVDMEINYLFTNDTEYLNNFTTFIPKNQRPMPNNNNMNNNNPNNNNNNNNNGGYQPPVDAKTIFVKEIRNRIEAYFKLIVRNLRDSIPKCIGNNLVNEIENNMQIELYNQLYKSTDVVNLLNEPEHIATKRKELVELIKVMKNAQKIIRRDPDLMTVMKININDSDIAPPKEENNIQQQNSFKQEIPKINNNNPSNNFKSNNSSSNNMNKPNNTGDIKKKNYGNLFG